MKLYYKLANGEWIPDYSVEKAFLICEGKPRYGNESEFLDWLASKLNTTILEVKSSTDPELFNELLTRENKIMAMQVYKDKHDCTLAEARDVVELLLGGDDDGQI